MNQTLQNTRVSKNFKNELNQFFNKWVEENLEFEKKQEDLFWEKYHSLLVDRSKASLGALENEEGRKLARSPEEKMKYLKDSFFTGKHLSNENFIQQDLTTKEVRKYRLSSKTPSLVKEIAANQPITSQVGNSFMKIKATCKDFDPDGFHPKLLKHSEPHFQLLTRLLNNSLDKEKWV